jgi:hypothetical protein
MKMKFWVTGTVALALGTVGCQPPAPEPEDVAEVTAKRSGDLVRNLGSSMRTLSNLSALKMLTDVASSVGGFDNVGGAASRACPSTHRANRRPVEGEGWSRGAEEGR